MAEPASVFKVYVVGIGPEGLAGLSPWARQIVEQAETLVGGGRLLRLVPPSSAERLTLGSGLGAVVDQIQARLGQRKVVVLASGDPGFFGIAKLLVQQLGKDQVEIIPAISSLQLAFARIKESWEDAICLSVHGRPLAGLATSVAGHLKVAILTDDTNSPTAVARAVLSAGIRGYRAYVCENLGEPNERVLALDLATLAETATAGCSVLILLQEDDVRNQPEGTPADPGVVRHGIPDDEFAQRRPRHGLLTKLEVRLISLARLRLSRSSTVWDVGAGSGAVAVEAALVARTGRVYAIERDEEGIGLIGQNAVKFGAGNLVIVPGTAPAALADLPAPDAVFVGGSGGQLVGILDVVAQRLSANGRVVVNAATLETAATALSGLRERGFAVETTLVQIARSKDLGGLTHLAALDPVFVIAGERRCD